MNRLVAFGEILLRLSPPGRELLLQTPGLDVWVGGAEANVATALARLGHDAAMVSALPANPLADAAVTTLRGHGVDCSGIVRRAGRMGLYFVESGAGLRPTDIHYDRAHSSFADAPGDIWDWPRLLAGADRLHLSGITPALGLDPAAAAEAAVRAAVALGVPVSFDGNYRARLWEMRGGDPRTILRPLVEQCDILFGSRRDIALLLDQPFEADGEQGHRAAADAAFLAFPRLRLIATTERDVHHGDSHSIAARIDTCDETIRTATIHVADIVDRVGSGDAFAAGVLHGLATAGSIGAAADAGLALMALKHSLPGDASLFGRRELDAFSAQALDVRR